ncbi:MAG: (d)CMP kinase [Christensenellales bacterium]
MKKIFTIAIDGPVGAGKSTVADAVAQQLGILHLDTGAMYRALALHVLSLGINVQDEQAVIELIQGSQVSIDVVFEDDAQRTLLNGQDVSTLIRTQEVGNAASTISRYRPVRQWLVKRQQALATQQSMLLDGRDIGTVVLPQADVKVYLTASPETRAQRRYLQLLDQGQHTDFDEVLSQLLARDYQDQTRAVDPLRQAEDAVLLDTTHMTFEQSVEAIVQLAEEACRT